MTLLICAQSVDKKEPALGFFHRWVEEFATHFDRVEVICLREGQHSFPENVRVHSLREGSKLQRAWRFFKLLRALHYDAVFVHMSQEYAVLGGPLWKMLGKPVYMWRNHYQGSFITDIAASFCKNVFCTSKLSYTAKYSKTLFMPVGVDTQTFTPTVHTSRVPRSVLFFGRLASSKNPKLLMEALATLRSRGNDFTATFCGPVEKNYLMELEKKVVQLGIASSVRFLPARSHAEAAQLYAEHDIYVNCSPGGMYDKTMFEAAAAGCLILVSSKDMSEHIPAACSFIENNKEDLAHKLAYLLNASPGEAAELRSKLQEFVSRHNLEHLIKEVSRVIR